MVELPGRACHDESNRFGLIAACTLLRLLLIVLQMTIAGESCHSCRKQKSIMH